MGTKRSADDLDLAQPRSRRRNPKRAKPSSFAEKDSDSSAPSSCSVSEDSALQSSPPVSEHTRRTSLSSLQTSPSTADSESSVSDSDSATESSSKDGDDSEIVTIGGPKKPRMTHDDATEGAKDLRTRLDALLAQLAASNDLLASSGGQLSMEDVEDDEQHIEMNLGLGVLEETGQGDSGSSSGMSDDDKDDTLLSSGAVQQSRKDRRSDVMRKLRGQRSAQQQPDIEDLG